MKKKMFKYRAIDFGKSSIVVGIVFADNTDEAAQILQNSNCFAKNEAIIVDFEIIPINDFCSIHSHTF